MTLLVVVSLATWSGPLAIAALPAYVSTDPPQTGAPLSKGVAILDVGLGLVGEAVLVRIQTDGEHGTTTPDTIVHHLYFDGDWLVRGDVQLQVRNGEPYLGLLQLTYAEGSETIPLDFAYDADLSEVSAVVPRDVFAGVLDHPYAQVVARHCLSVCTTGPVAPDSDRAPQWGYYPPFDPATGTWR